MRTRLTWYGWWWRTLALRGPPMPRTFQRTCKTEQRVGVNDRSVGTVNDSRQALTFRRLSLPFTLRTRARSFGPCLRAVPSGCAFWREAMPPIAARRSHQKRTLSFALCADAHRVPPPGFEPLLDRTSVSHFDSNVTACDVASGYSSARWPRFRPRATSSTPPCNNGLSPLKPT